MGLRFFIRAHTRVAPGRRVTTLTAPQFAQQTLPVLQKHLATAESLAK